MQTKTRTLVLCAVMAAVLAILSPITIPVGPVPFTLGFFAVFLTGAMLPPAAAAASLSVYILLGAIGLPVFSGFQAGPQVLAGPTGGYVAGYFIIAIATSFVVRRTTKFGVRLAAALAAMAACYALGTLWYMLVTQSTFAAGLMVCVIPFAIPDTIKAMLALALANVLRRRLQKGG
jgi:biotin transport system substrate-specific component